MEDVERAPLINKTRENYESFSNGAHSSPSPNNTMVFCVHGNKWGMTQCCQDLTTTPEQALQQHCHERRKDSVDKKARRKLIIASVLCVFFMTGEVVGGVLANSLAIASDAAHLLTDFASFMISLFALYVASLPRNEKMNFGFHRAEVIGAVVSVLLIWVVTGVLVAMATQRLINQNYEIDALVMLITSAFGVLFNVIMACSLHQHGHSHGSTGDTSSREEGGHDHQEENINVRAAYIHVIGDIIQSLGVTAAAIIIYFYPSWGFIDPICTYLFSILVLLTTVKILKDTLRVLMEGTPTGFDFSLVRDIFMSVSGIRQVHNLRIWSLTTDKTALAAHLVIDEGVAPQAVLADATAKIRARYNLYEMTLQVEEFQEDMVDCDQCHDTA